jgi:hypothetical protein
MAALIRELCALSILCGVTMALAPEGSARRAMSFACSVVMLCCVLFGVKALDWDEYALELSRYREREQVFLEQSTEIRDELDRRVIEAECRAYVMEQAVRLGLPLQDASVHVEWSMEGVWVPYSAMLRGDASDPHQKELSRLLEAELGIPETRQEWKQDD